MRTRRQSRAAVSARIRRAVERVVSRGAHKNRPSPGSGARLDLPSDIRPPRCDGCGKPTELVADTCSTCGEVRQLCAWCQSFEPLTDVRGFCSECHDLMLPDEEECAGPLEE
jgi:hypothetical protein